MIEIAKVECCRNCVSCKLLYVPPADCYSEVVKAVGGTKNSYVCTAMIEIGEADRVQFLGDDSGFCELFTEKEIANEDTA